MQKQHILFISPNKDWGGSEVLWTYAAKQLARDGHTITACLHYENKLLDEPAGKINIILLGNRYVYPKIAGKIFQKLLFRKYSPIDRLAEKMDKQPPLLAVLSLGTNISGWEFMQFFIEKRIPYVVINQLVTEFFWVFLDTRKIERLRTLYDSSLINFFVSRHNKDLHEKMLGVQSGNNRVIFNPVTRFSNDEILFPGLDHGNYRVALVGRLENFHKGYDILIEVLKLEKWKNRNVIFSIYGKGPHEDLIRTWIDLYQIKNLVIQQHVEDISRIWEMNHILLMPSRMEGQSLSLIEAMYYKRAAIVTKVGGTEELIEEGKSGFFANAITPEAIDEVLERAWSQRSEWEIMGVSAYRHIKLKHPSDAVSFFISQLPGFL